MGQTVSRLKDLISTNRIRVVCGENHAQAILEHVPDLPSDQVWVEPKPRNTAPALALAAILLKAQDPEAVMVVLPADHLILAADWKKFSQDVQLAAQVAQTQDALVTFGIPPDHGATGFGYLEQGEKLKLAGGECFKVKAFHEKPDEDTAKAYWKSGNFLWNSGMFVWQVKTFLRELKDCQPEAFALFQDLASTIGSEDFSSRLVEVFNKVDSISVDYAVMEKASRVFMVPASFSWDDVGSLTALGKVLSPDAKGNRSLGNFVALDAEDNLILSKNKPVAIIGINDLLVVETPDALLVLPKDRAQDVKEIVNKLKEQGREDLL